MLIIIENVVQQEVYTFIDPAGVNTHIDSGALRLWCLEQHRQGKLQVFDTLVDPAIARHFAEVDRSIDLDHAFKVWSMKEHDPIIYCSDGTRDEQGAPNVMLADGHHRYFSAAINQKEIIPAFILEPAQWEPFRVNLPTISAEELRAREPKERIRHASS